MKPPSRRVPLPTYTGPSSRVPLRTSAPSSITTGPLLTSNTTPGSTVARRLMTSAGSPRTMLPSGTPEEGAARKSAQSAGSRRSSAVTRS